MTSSDFSFQFPFIVEGYIFDSKKTRCHKKWLCEEDFSLKHVNSKSLSSIILSVNNNKSYTYYQDSDGKCLVKINDISIDDIIKKNWNKLLPYIPSIYDGYSNIDLETMRKRTKSWSGYERLEKNKYDYISDKFEKIYILDKEIICQLPSHPVLVARVSENNDWTIKLEHNVNHHLKNGRHIDDPHYLSAPKYYFRADQVNEAIAFIESFEGHISYVDDITVQIPHLLPDDHVELQHREIRQYLEKIIVMNMHIASKQTAFLYTQCRENHTWEHTQSMIESCLEDKLPVNEAVQRRFDDISSPYLFVEKLQF